MVNPNINFNFPASTFIFISAIALSYFSHVGWWALAGLAYFLYSKMLGGTQNPPPLGRSKTAI